MEEIIIKELEKKDFVKYSGFFETLRSLTEISDIGNSEAADTLKKINNQNSHIFIAVIGQEIVGTVMLLIEQKFIHGQGLVGHIEDVATRKGHEGKGIGKKVMNFAIEYAKKNGCFKMILDCKEHNVKFYEKFGFYTHELMMRLDL